MKKIISLITALLLLTAIFSGCQATPEKPVVIQKDYDGMIEKAKETPTAKEAPPERYEAELSGLNGAFRVNVHADMTMPQDKNYPVLEVKNHTITDEEAGHIIDTLCKGEMLACGDGGEYILSKSELQKYILYWKSQGKSEDGKYTFQRDIDIYESLLSETPETAPPMNRKFENGKIYQMQNNRLTTREDENRQYIYGMSSKDGLHETIGISRSTDGRESYVVYMADASALVPFGAAGFETYTTAETLQKADAEYREVYLAQGILPDALPDIAVTEQESVALADELIDELGIDYASSIFAEKVYGVNLIIKNNISEYTPARCVWRIRYGRAAGGLCTTYTRNRSATLGDDQFAESWEYEQISVYVDDSGIVGFFWRAPYEITETKVENAAVLGFDEIREIFEQMMFVKYSYYENFGVIITIDIDNVRFGLTRICSPNDSKKGLLVPTWDFFGTWGFTKQGSDEIDTSESIPYESYLTINAIDGSIIDRNMGY